MKKEFKEVQFRINIAENDFNTKLRQINKFLSKGLKVKCIVSFGGREIQHPEEGDKLLDKIVSKMENGKLVNKTPLKGRDLTAFFAPNAPALKKAS